MNDLTRKDIERAVDAAFLAEMDPETYERIERAKACAAAGLNITQTAKEIGIPRTTFNNLRKKYLPDVKFQVKHLRPSVEKYVECQKAGLSIPEAAKKLGVCYQSVYNVAVRYNLNFARAVRKRKTPANLKKQAAKESKPQNPIRDMEKDAEAIRTRHRRAFQ